MGNANFANFDSKSIKDFVKNNFSQEQKAKLKRRDFMVLSDILNVEMPDDYKMNFFHLGMLYCMDVDKDGRFYLEDLVTFASDTMQLVQDLKGKKLQHEISG